MVGGLAFAVDYAVLYLLVSFGGIHYLIAAAIAFLCGLIVNYALCVTWIFHYRALTDRRHEFVVFAMIGVGGLILNGAILFALTEYAGFHYLQSKLVAAAIILVFNFSLRRSILFTKRSGRA